MICFNKKLFESHSHSASYFGGTIYYGLLDEIYFPKSFIGNPLVVQSYNSNNQSTLVMTNIRNITQDYFQSYIYSSSSRTETDFYIEYIAIGKWK